MRYAMPINTVDVILDTARGVYEDVVKIKNLPFPELESRAKAIWAAERRARHAAYMRKWRARRR